MSGRKDPYLFSFKIPFFSPRKWLYLLSALVCIGCIAFALFYLFSGYKYLIHWFENLNGCFYQKDVWPSRFFTADTKSTGNYLCILALVLCLPAFGYIGKRLRQKENTVSVTFRCALRDVLWPAGLIVLASGLWAWGNTLVAPAFDEVFSALNCAGIHPFQTLSYYMLPNNHLYFNFLNATLGHFCEDKVLSGRCISLAAYLGIALLAFYWFRRLIGNRFPAFLAVLIIALQFPVWGFSFQNRGYELYILAQWLAFISLFRYLQSGERCWLQLNTMSCIAGYLLLPSFLYFHTAQMLFIGVQQLLRKKPGRAFWKYQLIGLCFVFIFYLPAFCFSGIGAFSGNRYVSPMGLNLPDFINIALPVFRSYMDYCFSSLAGNDSIFNRILFLLPLLLLFFHKKPFWFSLGLFYAAMLLSFLALTLGMRRYPFHRNLGGELSIILAILIIMLYRFSRILFRKMNNRIAGNLFFSILLLSLGFHFIWKDRADVSNSLYFYDINATYEKIRADISDIPAGSSVGFTDECFYWKYLCEKRGLLTSACSTRQETYFVKLSREKFPKNAAGGYQLWQKLDDYELYQRK
jgi:hypothetical protein